MAFGRKKKDEPRSWSGKTAAELANEDGSLASAGSCLHPTQHCKKVSEKYEDGSIVTKWHCFYCHEDFETFA